MDSNNPAPVAAPVPAPAPAPATPAPAIAPSAPSPAPQSIRVSPLIDTSGREVTPFGTPVIKQDEIDFAELDKPPVKSQKAAKPPAAPEAPEAAGAAAEPQPAAPSAPESPDAPASPFALEAKPKLQNEQATTQRDYSTLPPEIAAVAKKLPNALYNQLTTTFKQFQSDIEAERAKVVELTKAKDEAASKYTADHPEAYKLDPQYNTLLSDYGRTTAELNHYTEQLALIEQGEAWRVVTGYNQAGEPVYQDVPAPADGRIDYRAKATITRALNQLASQEQQIQRQASAIQSHYRNAAEEVRVHYDNARTRLFPNMDPTKLQDPDEQKVYQWALDALPPAERRRKSAEFLGLAAVVVRRQAVALKNALDRAERAERLASSSGAADPVRPSRVAASVPATAGSANDPIDLAELERSFS